MVAGFYEPGDLGEKGGVFAGIKVRILLVLWGSLDSCEKRSGFEMGKGGGVTNGWLIGVRLTALDGGFKIGRLRMKDERRFLDLPARRVDQVRRIITAHFA